MFFAPLHIIYNTARAPSCLSLNQQLFCNAFDKKPVIFFTTGFGALMCLCHELEEVIRIGNGNTLKGDKIYQTSITGNNTICLLLSI
jgi:hypothetical protein